MSKKIKLLASAFVLFSFVGLAQNPFYYYKGEKRYLEASSNHLRESPYGVRFKKNARNFISFSKKRHFNKKKIVTSHFSNKR
jgi:hypothetical protein